MRLRLSKANSQPYAAVNFHETIAAQLATPSSWGVKLSSLKAQILKNKFGITVTAAITGAIALSQVTALINPIVGAYANVGALTLLTAVAIRSEKARLVAISAGILPVATMVNQSLPHSNALSESITFYCALLLLTLVYRYMFTLSMPAKPATLGWKQYLYLIPAVLVAGQLMAVLAYALLRNNFAFAALSFPIVASGMITFVLTEEMFFRGLIQRLANAIMHPYLAIALTAGLFTAMTFPFGSLSTTIFAAISSTVLCIIYYVEPNLILTAAANATLTLLFLIIMRVTWIR